MAGQAVQQLVLVLEQLVLVLEQQQQEQVTGPAEWALVELPVVQAGRELRVLAVARLAAVHER